MKKEKKVWLAEFEGHEIKVTNDGKAKLWIDGVEAAKEKGLVHLSYELTAPIPDTDYIVMAKLDATKESIVLCDIKVAKSIPVTYGKQDENGTFAPYSEEEIAKMKEDAEAAIIAASNILF